MLGIFRMQGPDFQEPMPLGLIIPEFLECSTEAAVHGRTVLQILQQHILLAASPHMPATIRGKEPEGCCRHQH